jgi:hypothetical protein
MNRSSVASFCGIGPSVKSGTISSSTPAAYYVGQTNAILAERGWGMSGSVFVNLWF